MPGVRLQKAELIERFDLSNLMAIRVGALLLEHVDMTETVLGMARPGSAVEKMLRHPRLLEQAAALDTDALQALAAETGAAGEGLFVVAQSDDWRTIALEEELLAEQAWDSPQPGTAADQADSAQPLAPASGGSIAAFDQGIQAEDLSSAFSTEDIAKLKLSALTSADPGAKVEAMRKLMFAPISDQEKGAVLLKILIDPISSARTEAVASLRSLGFDPSLAEALTALLEGDEGGKVFAADRTARLLGTVSDQEMFVVVELLLEQLREAPELSVAESLIKALGAAGRLLSQSDLHLRQFIEACLLRLASGQRQLAAAERRALLEVGRHDPNRVADLLWREAETTDVPAVRVFLMATLSQLELKGDLADAIAEGMVEQMLKPELDEDERLRLRYGAVRLGGPCLDPLLSRLPAAPADRQCIIIGVLDAIATERPIGRAGKTRVARQMLDTLKVAGRQVTVNILQSRICADREVDEEVQAGLASEFLANLREFNLPDMRQRITGTLTRIGARAVGPILDFVEDAPNDETSALALRILGEVAEELSQEWRQEDAERAVQLCLGCWQDGSMTHGAFVYALAHLCAAGLTPEDMANRLAAECRERLWQVTYPFDILEALGVLGGSAGCTLSHRVAITRILTDLAKREPPEEVGSEVATEDGVVYVFGKEADFDTIVLPLVVRGLERICLSSATTRSLREHIIMCLLDVWGSITQYKVIWGPLAIEALTAAVGRIGGHETTPLPYRVHIARVLSRQMYRFSVMRSLGELFQQAGPSPDLDDLAVEAANSMVEEWVAPDVTDGEREVFLLSLARTLTREDLDPEQKDVRLLRRRAIDLFLDALKDGLMGVREALALMKECPTVPLRQRSDIEDRLNKAFGLVTKPKGPKS